MVQNQNVNFFRRFEYFEYLDPTISHFNKLSYSYKIIMSKQYSTQFKEDLERVGLDSKVLFDKRNKVNRLVKFDKLMTNILVLYVPYSIYWHYRKGYFVTGKYWIDAYIYLKIVSVYCLLTFIKFHFLKTSCESILFPYFYKVEKEWFEIRDKKDKDVEHVSILIDDARSKSKFN